MKVLFVCGGNAARSQMAEAWARHYGLDAASAGTTPAKRISSGAASVMKEVGISMAGQHPKALDWDALPTFDKTITMGCGVAEACPTLHTDEDWGLDDPVHDGLERFRDVREEIRVRVEALAATADP